MTAKSVERLLNIGQHLTESESKLEYGPMPNRDDRPAEYRWRPVFNAAKFG